MTTPPTWLAQPPSAGAPEPTGPRWGTGRRVAAVVGGLCLVLLIAFPIGVAVFTARNTDAANPGSKPTGPPTEDLFFTPQSATLAGGGLPFGLELGVSVTAAERVDSRTVVLTPIGVRQVLDPAAASGRYLLVDLDITAKGGAVAFSRRDFALLLPDGRALRESTSEATLFDLFPRSIEANETSSASLVFDLPLGQEALLILVDQPGGLASWKVPGAAAPIADPSSLPGYTPRTGTSPRPAS